MTDRFSSLAFWLRHYAKEANAKDAKTLRVAAEAVEDMMSHLADFKELLESIPPEERTEALNRILHDIKALEESTQ